MSWTTLNEVCNDFQNGIGKNKEYYGSGVKVANIGDLYKSPTFKPEKFSLLEVNEKEKEKYSLKRGDILFVRSSLKREGVAVSSMYDSDEICLFSSFMIRCRPNEKLILPKFLAYQLRSSRLRNQLINASNTSTITNIAQPGLKKIGVFVPSLPNQKHITNLLEKADALRQKDKELLEYYDRLEQSVFLDMFGDPVLQRNGWEISSLDNIITEDIDYRGKTPPKSENGILLISSANVDKGKLDFSTPSYISLGNYEKWTTRGFCKPGDLLFTTEAPVGETAIYPEQGVYQLSRRVIAFRFDYNLVNPLFVLFVTLNNNWKLRLFKKLRGSTVPRILKQDILNQEIPLPPIALQNRFAHIIKNIRQQKNKVDQNIANSESLFQCLLQKAFKGELINGQTRDKAALERLTQQ